MIRYYRDALKYYLSLEKRERIALLALAVFMLVVIAWLGIWSPANTYVDDSKLDHDRYLELLTYLKSTENQARAGASGGAGSKIAGQSLLSSVSRASQGIGINPSRLQPEGAEAVSVWFDAVAFTKLMLWLERLESDQGIVVRQITIDRRDEPGQVSARLVLRH